ncbi:MAG: heavy metal-associated domain-containing protein [Bryobacteraceae bacterium]
MTLRLALAFAALLAAPASAQFRKIDIAFEGIGCASCVESLPPRMKRIRGVETAQVDAAKGTLTLTLAPENRVRLEQVRDAIQQDGTKAKSAAVEARGQIVKSDAGWTLQFPRGVSYSLSGPLSGDLSPGLKTITGTVAGLQDIVIAVTSARD